MALPLTRMTELEAVNYLLRAAGFDAVSTLDDAYLPLEASEAQARLHEVSRSFQNRGWSFNLDPDKELTPDESSHIDIDDDVLKITCTSWPRLREKLDTSVETPVRRLYNQDGETYTITGSVRCRVVTFLEWDALPQHAREYIRAVAAIRFLADYRGDEETKARLENELAAVIVSFYDIESEYTGRSFLDNPELAAGAGLFNLYA